MSGAVTDRPALHDALEFARSGDTLIVWKLDRLARSMKQLIETIENLRVLNKPINGERFQIYVEEVLAPTLSPGDIVIMDNLGAHKAKAVRAAIRGAVGY